MTQQTCCKSSRPASRPIARSLPGNSSRPRVTHRLRQVARRALLSMLIAGSAAMAVSGASVMAHDHVPRSDESVRIAPAANSLPSRLVGDAMLAQWFQAFDSAESVCGPAPEVANPETSAIISAASAGPLAAKQQQVDFGGGGVLAIHPTTAIQWQEYCKLQNLLAWGDQSKPWTSPLIYSADDQSIRPAAKKVSVVEVQSRELSRCLADLACEEPIDIAAKIDALADHWPIADSIAVAQPESAVAVAEVTVADAGDSNTQDDLASEGPKFGAAALLGGGPMVVTIAEDYMPYDLSPEDAIAMRMYPIDGPAISGAPISYLGARRTAIYGPVPNFEAISNWHQQVEPGIVLATPEADAPKAAAPTADVAAAEIAGPEGDRIEDLPESIVRMVGDAANWIVAASQPDSDFRRQASALRWSRQAGEVAGSGIGSADLAVGRIAVGLASVIQQQPQPRPLIAVPEEKWVAEATLEMPRGILEPAEVQADLPAADAIAVIVEPDDLEEAGLPTAELLQIELACKAALEVVKQQAARGAAQQPQVAEAIAQAAPDQSAPGQAAEPTEAALASELVRAQAVATAFDLAAESLERLAVNLRRAGDSIVRQAKADNAARQSILR